MRREIYEVYAKVVDANCNYNTLSGYPKTFDSRNYNDDLNKALMRAQAEYHETLGAMYKREDRQLQTVLLLSADGVVLASASIGEIAEVENQE